MSFVQHKTCLLLPDDVTIFNPLVYNILDLNRLGSHVSMRGRVEGRITAAVVLIPYYCKQLLHLVVNLRLWLPTSLIGNAVLLMASNFHLWYGASI